MTEKEELLMLLNIKMQNGKLIEEKIKEIKATYSQQTRVVNKDLSSNNDSASIVLKVGKERHIWSIDLTKNEIRLRFKIANGEIIERY